MAHLEARAFSAPARRAVLQPMPDDRTSSAPAGWLLAYVPALTGDPARRPYREVIALRDARYRYAGFGFNGVLTTGSTWHVASGRGGEASAERTTPAQKKSNPSASSLRALPRVRSAGSSRDRS